MNNDEQRDFSLSALYLALDDERRRREMTWKAVMEEINQGNVVRAVSHSIISTLRTKRVAEGDGVLQLLRWLNRSPESFVDGADVSAGAPLPKAAPGQVLRFDTRRLYEALDTRRSVRDMSWQEVAREIGGFVSANTLTRLRHGGRTNFPLVVRQARWAEQPTAAFVWAAPW